MPIQLRLMLIVGAVSTMIYFIGEIRKNQLQIKHALFWTVASMVLVIMSLLPTKVYEVIHYVGLQSPTNFVFLLLIFALIIKQFSDTVKISILERKLSILTQKIALIKMDEEKQYAAVKKAMGTESAAKSLEKELKKTPEESRGEILKEEPKEKSGEPVKENPEKETGEALQGMPEKEQEAVSGKEPGKVSEDAPTETLPEKSEEISGEISQEDKGRKPEGENAG